MFFFHFKLKSSGKSLSISAQAGSDTQNLPIFIEPHLPEIYG
jgi:hypothetical protein